MSNRNSYPICWKRIALPDSREIERLMPFPPPNSDSSAEGSNYDREPESLFIESGDDLDDDEIVLASDGAGSSLTLLEEYSIRERNSGKWAAVISLVCAVVSIAFACMIYTTL